MYRILYDLAERITKFQNEHAIVALALLIAFWVVAVVAWIGLQDLLAGAT